MGTNEKAKQHLNYYVLSLLQGLGYASFIWEQLKMTSATFFGLWTATPPPVIILARSTVWNPCNISPNSICGGHLKKIISSWFCVPGAGIGEDAGAVDALEEGLDDGVLLGHHDLRVAAPEVVDVVDGAVHVLHHLDEFRG